MLSLSDQCLGVEKKNFRFTLFTPIFSPFGVGGHKIYNFLSPYPTDATYQIWYRLACLRLKKMYDDKCQPIAIGHLSDSDDLKILVYMV